MKKRIGSKRKGLNIVELALVLAVVGIFILAAFAGYKKIYIPSQAKAEYSKVASVLAGIERAKNSLGGVFPSVSETTLGDENDAGVTVIRLELGGGDNIKDVADWTYDCPEGSDTTITLKTKKYDSGTLARLVARKINENNAPWTAAVESDNSLTITRSNVVCRTVNG